MLDDNIYPIHYKLHIEPNLDDFTFKGRVKIYIMFKKETEQFKLHIKNLNIKSILFDKTCIMYDEDTVNEEFTIYYKNKNIINKGLHMLEIKYDGTLGDVMDGFYRSSYKDANNETIYLATTQFESTGARMAFPCFDEPLFKATFDIIITTDKKYTILSNNTEKEIIVDGNKKTVLFNTSPKMSTYLVAFIIGHFDYVETYLDNPHFHNKKRIRVYKTSKTNDSKENLSYGLDMATKGLKWLIDWFKIDYPLDKVDLIGIPDFSSGAMENWGLITFRETQLLVEKDISLDEKQSIAQTICHELAHQWFGNLVTMKWWDYLWLNESMATYFGWRIVNDLHPEWNLRAKFVDEEFVAALELDSLDSSHPIEAHITNVNEIQTIFDAISYNKGSCVIRYLIEYLGENNFRNGMRRYINSHLFSNASSSDLWVSFKSFKSLKQTNINEMMDVWIKQKGYPYLKVQTLNGKTVIKQQKFTKLNKLNKSDNIVWDIRVNYIDQFNKTKKLVFNTKEIELSDVFIVNPYRIGFMRVQYSDYSFMKKVSDPYIFSYILDDAFQFAYSGYHSFILPFKIIIDNIKKIASFNLNSLFNSLTSHFIYLINLLDESKTQTVFISFINQHIIPICKNKYNKLGWDDSPYDDSNQVDLRETLINFLARYDNDIINIGLEKFDSDDWITRTNIVPLIVSRFGNDRQFKKLIMLYEKEVNIHTKRSLLTGITRVSDYNKNDFLYIKKYLLGKFFDEIKNQNKNLLI